ncbi:D-alanyl carrier protein [Paenibacillus curdlanolyticus YK9]|uniref:D-alanyl carrier protein n=1 Tax=Paenibacillus curdlanolyticus YK9 TaxID=717606 RepID=E0I5W2_9BACL|nr:phosphopantetheine-binding protein [Paenibacillus curdlanolyticus]EFM12354.1 D-alanyl carrier protein [Paenibacillus curdlanolyticus YK9]
MMKEKMIQMISEIKNEPALLDTLTGSSSILHDSGMESLQIVHFILQVEDAFDCEINFDEFDMDNLGTIDTFCEYIRQLNPELSNQAQR